MVHIPTGHELIFLDSLVIDRATLFNCLIGLNDYTISNCILSEVLNGQNIITVRLDVDNKITVSTLTNKTYSSAE